MTNKNSEIERNTAGYTENRERLSLALKPIVQEKIDDLLQHGAIPENAYKLIFDLVVLHATELNLGTEVWIKKILRPLLTVQLGSVELGSQESDDYFMTLVADEKEKQKHAQTMGNYVNIEDSAARIEKRHKEKFPNESSIVVYCKAKLFLIAAFGSPMEQMKKK
jgi:hypothetical protein